MEKEKQKILLGLPKGSLQEATFRLFRDAGFELEAKERCYSVKINDPDYECFLLRPQEIPRYIAQGKLSAGIAGEDCVLENKVKVKSLCDLSYQKKTFGKIKLVLAVHQSSPFKAVKDLAGKTIATERVNMVKDYLKKNNVKAKVEFSWGATEVKPPRFVDAIVDHAETGETLKANNLKVIDTVAEISTCLFCSKRAWADPFSRRKLQDLAILLQGTAQSEQLVGVIAHTEPKKEKEVLSFLQKYNKKPAFGKIAGTNLFDISFTCSNKESREILPSLKKLGLTDIVEYPAGKLL